VKIVTDLTQIAYLLVVVLLLVILGIVAVQYAKGKR
jgi:hypothetical protein